MPAIESQANVSELRVWVLTDGKIGDDVQCLAVAGRLSDGFEKRVISPRAPWSWLAPWGPIDPRDNPERAESPIGGAPPDVIIASGRRAVPYAKAVRNRNKGKTKIVILKDPRFGRSAADVIWAPAHDRLHSGNVFSTLTSPHEHGRHDADRERGALPEIANLSKPILGVVLGGPGGGAHYGSREAAVLAQRLNEAAKSFGAIAVTPSRRTPKEFSHDLDSHLQHPHKFFWNGEGENPYGDILMNADALVVAADSHNMMSEAVATPIGVYVYRPPGLARKLDWFANQLEAKGAVRPFLETAEPFTREPIDATPEIIAEIKARLFGNRLA